ncbi:MAG: YihY/virulence factor BrkB family protein [Bacteroidota bacterium]
MEQRVPQVKHIKRLVQRTLISVRHLMSDIKLPGFQGMGLYDVLQFFIKGLTDSKFTLLASAMSYQFFFSLFPTLLLAFLIIPYFRIENLQEQVLVFLVQFLPVADGQGITQEQLQVLVGDIVGNYFEGRTSILLIIVSIVLAFWGATRGIIAMMKAFTKPEKVFKKRNIFELYGTALVIFFVLGSLIILAVLAISFAKNGFDMLYEAEIMGLFWYRTCVQGVWLLITAGTVFVSISILYFLAPPTEERWKFFTPGSIAAGVLMLIAMVGLRYFFSNFTNFNRLYGSLGAIILMMVWFYYLSIMLLIGFELNAAIDLASYHQGKPKALPPASPEIFPVDPVDESNSSMAPGVNSNPGKQP